MSNKRKTVLAALATSLAEIAIREGRRAQTGGFPTATAAMELFGLPRRRFTAREDLPITHGIA
jgi:hypothetical protein